ncbi:DUF2281 domain-containing protein [Nostocaceae cyanobacterium CENA369]|uniref:DUF2281 domain-containing protein n=1 Tax=Dendronalium phyllosphericum CENA369 TaxID=1725256 RepID=A0A8J7IHZ7_9NOST|nr:DUF2281 domain-containing protein [Dendronalium phyllosphericum]MBH8577475.1 DUF2281 domain-containing protein [Dendronalium phyllosphericum CENA369]
MTIKQLLFQEIESSPESLLEETLDFLRFLKNKQQSDKKHTQQPQVKSEETPTNSYQSSYRPPSGRSILRHAGTWEGEDFQECLELVYATRGKAKFDYDLNPFE